MYFDRSATMSGAKRRVSAGCIAGRMPRDFVHRLLGTVGDQLLAVACAMLRNGTLYDSNLSRAKVAA